jgi:hypothetical protein
MTKKDKIELEARIQQVYDRAESRGIFDDNDDLTWWVEYTLKDDHVAYCLAWEDLDNRHAVFYINPELYKLYKKDYLVWIVPHEVAHHLCDYKTPEVYDHGQRWKKMMKRMGYKVRTKRMDAW